MHVIRARPFSAPLEPARDGGRDPTVVREDEELLLTSVTLSPQAIELEGIQLPGRPMDADSLLFVEATDSMGTVRVLSYRVRDRR